MSSEFRWGTRSSRSGRPTSRAQIRVYASIRLGDPSKPAMFARSRPYTRMAGCLYSMSTAVLSTAPSITRRAWCRRVGSARCERRLSRRSWVTMPICAPKAMRHARCEQTTVRRDQDIAIPIVARPLKARRCAMPNPRSRPMPRRGATPNDRRGSPASSPTSRTPAPFDSSASSRGPEWKSERWKLQVEAEARSRLKRNIRDLGSERR